MESINQSIIDANIHYQNILNMNIPLTLQKQNLNNQILKNESKEIIKSKRRTKDDFEGRNFSCKICNKCYLSYPALYTHYKQKHHSHYISDRRRGRPKKNIENFYKERIKYNPLNLSYYLKEGRTGITEIYDFENCIKDAFNIIYNNNEITVRERNLRKKMNKYDKVYEHPFLGIFLLSKHDRTVKNINENEICDVVFMHFLNKMSLHVNPFYFVRLISFITLFREYINISKNKNGNEENENEYYLQYKFYKNEPDYTACYPAEEIPHFCNGYINDFLECDKLSFGFRKEESIDLTQNICSWLYDNNFTTLKLSLILKNDL